jgi:hypothetical protein
MSKVIVAGLQGRTVELNLQRLVLGNQPNVLGMATAFLSLPGARKFAALTRQCRVNVSRVVAGVSGAITDPAAIRYLVDKGHNVRLGNHWPGIFHPKLLVGGDRFLNSGCLGVASCGYIGSANFTNAGLTRNLEIALTTTDPTLSKHVGDAFTAIWKITRSLTPGSLERYEQVFARRQRRRSLDDLKFLEILDDAEGVRPGRTAPLIAARLCNGVWAGLQSFTGEHTFQVEFPRQAGEALGGLLRTSGRRIPVECTDGVIRHVTFRYYRDNGMYRLNVPNDMPLVAWARAQQRGALLILRDRDHIQAEIIRGWRLEEVSDRSVALGTWGRTTTRQYGWF